MRYATLLDGSAIPKVGLGTWDIGGGMTPDYSQDEALVNQLKQIIRMGYTHIDTAEMYAATHTEELVGQAIRDFPRDDLFITTKVWRTHLRYDEVHQAIDGSLDRLGIAAVDLYLIHWPDDSVPLAETFRALNELVAAGKTKRIGVSNFDLAQLKQAIDLADTPLMANQVRYNLCSRGPERNGVLEFCQQNGIVVTAYCPLKDGVLNHPTVQAVARDIGATPSKVAINWLTRQRHVITIPKSLDAAHLEENLDALSLELPAEMAAALDRIA